MDRQEIDAIIGAYAARCALRLRSLGRSAESLFEDPRLARRLEEAGGRATGIVSSRGEGAGGAASGGPDPPGGGESSFRMIAEALETIESLGRMTGSPAARRARVLRFEVYGLKRLFEAGGKGHALPRAPFLYTVLDRHYVARGDVAATADALARGGSDIIQYRAKDIPWRERRSDLLSILEKAEGLPVIVNDDPELAIECGAAGVHLGADDPSPQRARDLLGPGAIIGITAHGPREIVEGSESGADYIGFGAVYSSATKPAVAEKGPKTLSVVCASTRLPVVAIGGIGAERTGEVLEAGAAGVAAIRSILEGDVLRECGEMAAAVSAFREKSHAPGNDLT